MNEYMNSTTLLKPEGCVAIVINVVIQASSNAAGALPGFLQTNEPLRRKDFHGIPSLSVNT